MHLDKLLARASDVTTINDNEWRMTHPGLPDTWGQGRTAFGGITAGFLHHALAQVVEKARGVRAYHTNFIGPVSVDKPLERIVEK